MNSPDVGAVVVRYRGGEEVARCLDSLFRHGGTRLAGVVLVDSGSGDGGGEELAARFPGATPVLLEANRSFAHAANRGVEAAPGERILLLNPDARLTSGALEAMAAHLDRHPLCPGVVPLLVGPGGAPQQRWQLRRLPRPFDLLTGRPGRPAFSQAPSRPTPVEQPAAACWLVRRTVWEGFGGLDPRYSPAWWEDVDFCARLRAAGAGAFTVVPGAVVVHEGGVSAAALGHRAFLEAYHRNMALYVLRHHGDRAPAILRGIRLSLLVRAILRPGRAPAYRAAAAAVRQVERRKGGS